MWAEAQNAEYFKIDSAKKKLGGFKRLEAMAVNKGLGSQNTTVQTATGSRTSRGLQQNTRQDMSVLVTAISWHIRYLLNIGGKFCFSLPEDLTVKDCIFMIVPCLYFCRVLQETMARSRAFARHETAPLKYSITSIIIAFINIK